MLQLINLILCYYFLILSSTKISKWSNMSYDMFTSKLYDAINLNSTFISIA